MNATPKECEDFMKWQMHQLCVSGESSHRSISLEVRQGRAGEPPRIFWSLHEIGKGKVQAMTFGQALELNKINDDICQAEAEMIAAQQKLQDLRDVAEAHRAASSKARNGETEAG